MASRLDLYRFGEHRPMFRTKAALKKERGFAPSIRFAEQVINDFGLINAQLIRIR